MNPAYVRLVVYVLSSIFNLIPASWVGLVQYDSATMMLTISVEGLAVAIVSGYVMSAAILSKWGKK